MYTNFHTYFLRWYDERDAMAPSGVDLRPAANFRLIFANSRSTRLDSSSCFRNRQFKSFMVRCKVHTHVYVIWMEIWCSLSSSKHNTCRWRHCMIPRLKIHTVWILRANARREMMREDGTETTVGDLLLTLLFALRKSDIKFWSPLAWDAMMYCYNARLCLI